MSKALEAVGIILIIFAVIGFFAGICIGVVWYFETGHYDTNKILLFSWIFAFVLGTLITFAIGLICIAMAHVFYYVINQSNKGNVEQESIE